MKHYILHPKLLLSLLCTIALTLLAVSCGNDNNADPSGSKEGNDIAKEQKPSVYVYLDNTCSMKGYQMASDPNVFTGVFAAISGYYSNSTIEGRIVKSNTIDSIDYNELKKGLTNCKISFTDSYQLEDLFKDMVKQVKKSKNSIYFLITDGIPSGTNDQIRNNTNYNIQNTSLLSDNVASALNPLKQGSYEVGVFRFESGFKGDYYKYDNSTVLLNDAQRPFYVIAIGASALVKSFSNATLKHFEYTNKAAFTSEPDGFKIMTSDNKVMKGVPHDSQTDVLINKSNTNVEFRLIGIPDGLSPNDVEITDVRSRKEIPVDKKGDFLTFKLPVKKGYAYPLKVTVMNTQPSWVDTYSIENDSDISASDKVTKTLNLKCLVEGISQGITHYGNSKYIFNGSWKIDVQ